MLMRSVLFFSALVFEVIVGIFCNHILRSIISICTTTFNRLFDTGAN